MRLKSSIFVSAMFRQVNAAGGFSTVLNKGAEEAGAIFIAHVKAAGMIDFYGPAPQAVFDDAGSGERMFELLATDQPQTAIATLIESQLKFDTDCWVVELELPKKVPALVKISQSDGSRPLP